MQKLRINGDRLWDSLQESATFGGTAKGGVRRLALSAEDKAVRDWFRVQCEAIGCTVTVDAVGNQFALYPGRSGNRAPIAMGSHLDTQPTGGKFDGILGVLAGLEVLRTVQDARFQPDSPLVVVNWTNEEGARFQPGMAGSGVYAGSLPLETVSDGCDGDGVRFGDALSEIGYRGSACAGRIGFGAYFELHIEQGPFLEAEKATIGVVTGAQGCRWFDLRVTGFENHAGTTPMHLRRDALVGAAKVSLAVHALASAYPGKAVGTVGALRVAPGSINVIPGNAFLSVDFRSPDAAILAALEADLRKEAEIVAGEHGLEIRMERLSSHAPLNFDSACIAAVRRSAVARGYTCRDIVSGAFHDAVNVAKTTPAAMIFVPCKNGVSHNEAEAATSEHCTAGANVLLDAVLCSVET